MHPETVCVESDAHRDSARAVDMLHTQLLATIVDPYSWKWTILILHHTLQTIVASMLPDAEASMPADRAADFLRIHRGVTLGEQQLARGRLLELIDRLESAQGVQVAPEIEADLERLTRYRDAFAHDLPTRWELDVQGLPRMAKSCLRLIDVIGWQARAEALTRHLSANAKAKLVASVNVLEALERQYRA